MPRRRNLVFVVSRLTTKRMDARIIMPGTAGGKPVVESNRDGKEKSQGQRSQSIRGEMT